jgi:hypothetical protein
MTIDTCIHNTSLYLPYMMQNQPWTYNTTPDWYGSLKESIHGIWAASTTNILFVRMLKFSNKNKNLKDEKREKEHREF